MVRETNRRRTTVLAATGACAIAGLVLAAAATAAPVVRTAAGANAAAITPVRDQFRVDLGGGTVAGANGSFGGLRREINWDGTPEPNSEPNTLPFNFFNVRGVNFSGAPAFMVSNNVPSRFNTLNATYDDAFAAFSLQKLFTPLGTTSYDVDFVLPGTNTAATTSGFGAIFADVDQPGSSRLELYGVGGKLLASENAPPSGVPNGGLSFVGISFNGKERVTKARLVTGNTAVQLNPGLSPADVTQGGPGDVVVLDDFLYGETRLPTAGQPVLGKLKKVKISRGGKKAVAIPFTNDGETAVAGAKACLKLNKAARNKVAVKGKPCRSLGTVEPGATATAKLRLRSVAGTGNVPGVKAQLKGSGIDTVSRKLKVTVK